MEKDIKKDYMAIAIEYARKAAKRGEVPVGAVIVCGGKIIATGYNMREGRRNALAHAEIIAINAACKKLKSWRLDDSIIYVTLQPCLMCAGAILNARIKTVVIGARDDKQKADESALEIYNKNSLNWKTEVIFDKCEECSQILKAFFAGKRYNTAT